MQKSMAALGCGVTGWLVMALLMAGQEPAWVNLAGIGAGFAGLICARGFGGQSVQGAGLAVGAAVLATFLGALVAGLPMTLPMALRGEWFIPLIAPVFVFAGLWQMPLALAVWMAGMGATHLALRRYSLKNRLSLI